MADLRTSGRPEADGGNDGLSAEEIFAAGINDPKKGKARDLRRLLHVEQLRQITGLQAHFGAGRLGKIAMVFFQPFGIAAKQVGAQKSVPGLRSQFSG